MIRYFDNAASSWPKPPSVVETMERIMRECTANPGRGGHQMAVQASRILFDTRKQLAKLFHIKNPNDIFFMQNTTMALNVAIQGYVRPHDHVISTSMEHNSVRRPLELLKMQRNINVDYVPQDAAGTIDLNAYKKMFRKNTRLVVLNHGSNLLGTILPLADMVELAKMNGVAVLVDAAQTAGVFPIDVQALGIDMLAFPGHKGLFGPQGTGGLYVQPNLELEPLIVGGTGSRSEDKLQPMVRPDRYESGTQNTVGIAGLGEGVKFVLGESIERIHDKEGKKIQQLHERLLAMNGIRILGPELGVQRTGLVSFLLKDIDPAEVAFILDQSFQIAVRAGYHCTPLAHRLAGSLERGAVRASISYFTSDEDIERFIEAISEVSRHYS